MRIPRQRWEKNGTSPVSLLRHQDLSNMPTSLAPACQSQRHFQTGPHFAKLECTSHMARNFMLSRAHFLLVPAALVATLGCNDSTSPGASKDPANLGTLSVGGVRVLTFAQAQNGLTIPASASSATYLVVAANVAGDTGSVPQFTVTGDYQVPGLSPNVGLDRAPAVATVRSPFAHPHYTRVGGPRGATFEARVRQFEKARLPRLMRRRTTATSPLLRKDNVPVGTVPTVGQQFTFNVPGSGSDLCNNFDTVTATVQAVSQHAVILTDVNSPAGGFTSTDITNLATEFDTYIYPTEAGYYGTPTDLDQNGHVFILFTPAVNQLTPANTAQQYGFVGGYTFAGDFFPTASCAESNQGEIFYMLAPDPTGQFGNVFSTSFVISQSRSTMAHEFQHAINSANRVVNDAPTFESAWLDEALSCTAEDNVGRAELGLGDLQTITVDMAANMDTSMFDTFFYQNFARAQSFLTRPDTIGPVVTDDRIEADLAAFGAAWAMIRYSADWFSNNDPRAFMRGLVAGPDSGTTNLVSHAGVPLDTVLAHWLVTLYTDNQGIPNLPAQYNYKTYTFRDIISALCADQMCTAPTYLPVTAIGDGTTTMTVGIPSTSAAYFITSKTTGGARTIKVLAPGGGSAATLASGRLYVVRTQ